MNYSYIPQQYYIKGIKGAFGSNEEYNYTFRNYILGDKLKDYINSSDREERIIEHLAFYHELTHFEQDSCFFACISKGLFEEIMSNIVYSNDSLYNEIGDSSFFDKNGFLHSSINDELLLEISTIYSYIFRTPYEYIDADTAKTRFVKMDYKDMLESHAEIKSLFNYIQDFASTQNNCEAINQMIYNTDRFGLFFDNINEDSKIQFHGNANYINRRYQVVRHNFITYFINNNSDFLKFYINETLFDLKFLLFLYSTELPLGNHLIMNYVRMVEFFMMVTVELSMAIPPAFEILQQCKNNPEKAIQFNPGYRFFKILNIFDKYAHFFNLVDITKMRWEELFNFVSIYDKWYTYSNLFVLYKDSLTIGRSNRSMLSFGQLNHISRKRLFPLKQTLLGMYDIFHYHNKSFAIHYENKYVVVFSKEKNELQEICVEYSEWELIYNRIHHIFPENTINNNQKLFAIDYVTDIVINKFVRWKYIILKDGLEKHRKCPFLYGCPIKSQSCENLSHYPNFNFDLCIVNYLRQYNPSKDII